MGLLMRESRDADVVRDKRERECATLLPQKTMLKKEAQKNIQTSANKTGGFIPTPPDLLSRDSLMVTG